MNVAVTLRLGINLMALPVLLASMVKLTAGTWYVPVGIINTLVELARIMSILFRSE